MKLDTFAIADFIEKTLKSAGRILQEGYGRAHQIEHKGKIDLLTEYDKRSEEFILSQLKKHYPEHSILAEESGRSDKQGDYLWVVDPLDGTTNFAHNYPFFCVTMALLEREEPIVGGTYDPVRDEMFVAIKGAGATLNGKPIKVSDTKLLSESLLVTGFPYHVHESGANLKQFEAFIRTAQAVRRDGSAALDLCYVACGRFDGFWEPDLNPWDWSAGALFVREAGGKVTNYAGKRFSPFDNTILASNAYIHNAMLNVLKSAPKT